MNYKVIKAHSVLPIDTILEEVEGGKLTAFLDGLSMTFPRDILEMGILEPIIQVEINSEIVNIDEVEEEHLWRVDFAVTCTRTKLNTIKEFITENIDRIIDEKI